MTKINKSSKSTIVIAILSFLLVSVLVFGGTYAYFSAKSNAVGGTMTTGTLHIYLREDEMILEGDTALGDVGTVLPGQTIHEAEYTVDMKAATNLSDEDLMDSTISAFVRVKVVAVLDEDACPLDASGKTYKNNNGGDSHLTPETIFEITSDSTEWIAYDGYLYYVETNSYKENSTVAELTNTATLPITIAVNKDVGNGGSTYFMGVGGSFVISVEAIQADHLGEEEYTVASLANIWGDTVTSYS